jgi:hypothetical protein
MQELHVDECIKSTAEQISLRAFSGTFKKEFNLHFGHQTLDPYKFCNEWAMKIEAVSTSDDSSKLRGECELHLWKVRRAC